MSDYVIRSGSWTLLETEAKMVRTEVFIKEQNIAAADEWDLEDQKSLHFIVYDQNQAIATARLLENHSIGRVAVLNQYRGKGIGRILMRHIMDVGQQQKRPYLKLSAQVHAIGFYQSLAFEVKGEEYLDCGIPHVDMFFMN